MLLRLVGRGEDEKRAVIHTIGPVWDANEVWLVVAAGATFAAFPAWCATFRSGFYLPLLLLILGLVVRPVALEFWSKGDERTRSRWEWALLAGSVVPAFLWGLAFANVVRGVPMGADHEMSGSLVDLFGPYALLGGLTSLLLCATHGAVFLMLKTTGNVLVRARRAVLALAPLSAASTVAFVSWTLADSAEAWAVSAGVIAGAGALLVPLLAVRRPGWAFAANGGAIAAVWSMLFLELYPNVVVSSTSAAYNLTLGNAASSTYTLGVMTVVAALMVPLILALQAWTYWTFRSRVGLEDVVERPVPLPLAERRGRDRRAA